MRRNTIKLAIAMVCSMQILPAYAEGVFDIRPYVGGDITYDDNVFRFNTEAQADALGYSMSDTIKTLQAGVNIQSKLSKQVFIFSGNLSDYQYNENTFLDNLGRDWQVAWNWQLGEDFYGELSTFDQESISGFDNNNDRARNNRVFALDRARINWQMKPRFTTYAQFEKVGVENDLETFAVFNRDDDVEEYGLRYTSRARNTIGIFYRNTDSDFPLRSGVNALAFGRETNNKQWGFDLIWQLTSKINFSGRLLKNNFTRANATQEGFDQINHRYNLAYLLSSKTSLQLSVFDEATQVEDIASAYVRFKGGDLNWNWDATSKVTVNTGLNYTRRAFLGGTTATLALIGATAREQKDKTLTANLGLTYRPTQKASVSLRYAYADREANVENFAFRYNTISLVGRYTF